MCHGVGSILAFQHWIGPCSHCPVSLSSSPPMALRAEAGMCQVGDIWVGMWGEPAPSPKNSAGCRLQAAAVSQCCGQSLVGQDPGCNFGWGVGSSLAPLTQLQQGWDSVLVFFSVLLSQQWICLPGDLILRLWMKKAMEIFAAFFEMLASIPVCKRGLQMGLPLQQTWRRVLVSGLCATTVIMRHRMSILPLSSVPRIWPLAMQMSPTDPSSF